MSAEGMPPLPEPTVDGSVYHEQLKICYTSKVHFTADQVLAYGRLVAQACMRLCEIVEDNYQQEDGRKWPEMRADAASGAASCRYAIDARFNPEQAK